MMDSATPTDHNGELPKSNREREFGVKDDSVCVEVQNELPKTAENSSAIQTGCHSAYVNASLDITDEEPIPNLPSDASRSVNIALDNSSEREVPVQNVNDFVVVDLSPVETETEVPPSPRVQIPGQERLTLSVLQNYQPTLGSTLFSFFMTVLFVGILWIVVFTIFGAKGHAIAGVFLGLFLIGLVLNTCFLRFYFRLKIFFGVQSLLRRQEIAAQQIEEEEEGRRTKAAEPPPSYASLVDAAPPPYSSVVDKPPKDPSRLCPSCQSREISTSEFCPSCQTKQDDAEMNPSVGS